MISKLEIAHKETSTLSILQWGHTLFHIFTDKQLHNTMATWCSGVSGLDWILSAALCGIAWLCLWCDSSTCSSKTLDIDEEVTKVI